MRFVLSALFGLGRALYQVLGAERTLQVLGALTALLLPVHLYLIANAPVELQMGIVQKIFYFHVPSAYAMYVGFTAAMIGSVGYLLKRDARYDAMAVAGAEVGLLFCAIVLVTGPLWARNAWGTFWTWDPRLTTTLLAAMIFSSFVALRSIGAAGEAEKRFASALGIVGFALLPVIHYSVQAWRGQHPMVGFNMHPDMLPPFLLGFLVFTLLSIVLIWTRGRAEMLRHRLAVLAEDAASEGLLEGSA
jgi:heme exporter protein C